MNFFITAIQLSQHPLLKSPYLSQGSEMLSLLRSKFPHGFESISVFSILLHWFTGVFPFQRHRLPSVLPCPEGLAPW